MLVKDQDEMKRCIHVEEFINPDRKKRKYTHSYSENNEQENSCKKAIQRKTKDCVKDCMHLQFKLLNVHSTLNKSQHTYFDDSGNVINAHNKRLHAPLSNVSTEKEKNNDDEYHSVKGSTAETSPSNKNECVLISEVYTKHIISEIKKDRTLKKYWHKRFSLFSQFDKGIMLDHESWFSVTPEKIAKRTAERCKCDVLVDAFCGAGGNLIHFASTCKRVIAIDIDPEKIKLAQHNARIYGVADRIEFIIGDFFKLCSRIQADVVFLSPPWGGPSYKKSKKFDLETMLKPLPLTEMINHAKKITNNLALYLPRHSNVDQLVYAAGFSSDVEIENNFLDNKLIALTVYYGDIVKK